MAFSDVLAFLFERAKEKDPSITNQEHFARRHGISREHMNQFLTGNVPVPAKTIWEIIEREGYKFEECIRLPDTRVAITKHDELFHHLETIIASGDKDRIWGITINLRDIAAGALEEKRRRRRKAREPTDTIPRKQQRT